MTRHDINANDFQTFLAKKGIKCNIQNRNILITGMMRTAAKTYTVFDFLVSQILQNEVDGKVLYITKIVGEVGKENNRGTFYDTEKTIRKIEKKHDVHTEKLKVCMVAGEDKICQKHINLQNSHKEKEAQKILLCSECGKDEEEFPDTLKNVLARISTLTPDKNRELSDKYGVCPKKIRKYYAENVADIILLSYAMLRFWIPKVKYSVVIFDEARHLNEYQKLDVVTFIGNNRSTVEDYINAVSKCHTRKYFNNLYAPDWWKNETETYVDIYIGVIVGKIKALLKSQEIAKEYLSTSDEEPEGLFVEEDEKIKLEYQPWPPDAEFLDEQIQNLEPEKIDALKKKLAHILVNDNVSSDEEREELKKNIEIINKLSEIAGCSKIEVEILETPLLSKESVEYNITLRPFRQFRRISSSLTFYLEGTPYPPKFYTMWLGLKKWEIDEVALPSEVPITIIYEDTKGVTKAIYGYGNNSDQFKRHIKLISGLKEQIEKINLKLAIGARTKAVSSMLGRNGVKSDLVCGDTSGEGVQIDCDVLILEGTQIRNLNVDTSRKFSIARAVGTRFIKQTLQEYQNIVNLQTMLQTAFRGIDRTGKRKNVIVLLGNQMPIRGQCWIELAKSHWDYLKSDNVRYVEIKSNQDQDNKIKEIMEVITNPNYDYTISPFENQMLRYILRQEKIKQTTVVNHFLNSKDVIKRTKQEILDTLATLKKRNGILAIKEKRNTVIFP